MQQHTVAHFDAESLVNQLEDYTTYQLKLQEGTGTAQVYSLFPGIELARVDIASRQYMPAIKKSRRIIEMNHCRAGRFECRMGDGCLQYVGEGDLFLSPLQNYCDSIELPLGFYQGCMITIDLDRAPAQWEHLIPGMPKDICQRLERFFALDACFLIQSREPLHHIFSGIYAEPQEAQAAYYRIKVLELLLYLSAINPENEKQKHFYAKQQVDIVKQIQKQMTRQLSTRFTIEELAQEYCISATALKQHFKGVFGQSMAAYMREYRVQEAARLLRDTEDSVAEIAAAVGYESQSKFSAAFKGIMHTTPLEYKKVHSGR